MNAIAKKKDATSVFLVRLEEFDREMAELMSLRARNFDVNVIEANWGHVGEMLKRVIAMREAVNPGSTK